MRITRETLLKIARDTAEQRARRSRGLVCIYLTGSLLNEQPLLGGTADIDLVVIHSSEPPMPREVVRLTDEVHIDLAHYSADRFAQPRRLRTDPWVGSYLCADPIQLYDRQHWFEFVQASVCASFKQPEYVLARARALADQARQEWLALQGSSESAPRALRRYLTLLQQAGNALCLLTGRPLPLRRFLLQLPERAAAAQRPEFAGQLAGLIGDPARLDNESALAAWEQDLAAAAALPDCPPRLQSPRHPYYTRAAQALQADYPAAALWILLNTWTDAAIRIEPGDAYARALAALGLGPAQFPERLAATDPLLDSLEETLDGYARRNGIL